MIIIPLTNSIKIDNYLSFYVQELVKNCTLLDKHPQMISIPTFNLTLEQESINYKNFKL